jgi:tetratricopeptide (TPR) repeat protein
LKKVDQLRGKATLQEVLYVSSPKALKRLSLGYRGLMADIYWTRAVQYFGSRHHSGARDYRLLGPLLEITTALDPQLTIAYEYGSNFLAAPIPQGAGDPQKAIELVQFGIRENPDQWRLYYDLGFIYYMELKDYRAAAEAFSHGSTLPNAHPFLKVMAAQMALHAGEIPMARMMWTIVYQSPKLDPDVKANARAHLVALQVDEDVIALEKAVADFKNIKGHLPVSLQELKTSGILPHNSIEDPSRRPYKLMPDGRVELSKPDDFPFVTRGTPPGYVAPPPKFLSTD